MLMIVYATLDGLEKYVIFLHVPILVIMDIAKHQNTANVSRCGKIHH